MLRSVIGAAAAVFLLAGPALAGHCPEDAAAIDAAIDKINVSDDERTEIIALRDRGMELHEAGDHAESEAALAEAMRRLLLAVE